MTNINYNNEQYNLLLKEITPIKKMVKIMKILIKKSLFLFLIPIILIIFKYNKAGYICLGLSFFIFLFVVIAKNMLNNFIKTIENKDFKVIRKKCIEYINQTNNNKECLQVKTEDNKIYVLINENIENNYINKNIDIILGNNSKYVQFAVPNKENLENNNENIIENNNLEDDSIE